MNARDYSPYAPPQAAAPGVHVAGAPVYTPNQIALATFIGSPVAGTVLLALNERRLGRDALFLPTLLVGFLASIALVGIGAVLPDGVPTMPFALLGIFGMRGAAHLRQQALVADYVARGGRKGSSWTAFGVGLLGMVVVLAVILAAVAVFEG